ncbi:MAG: PAS domain S-box protein [Phycisphaerae bacterium]|nr:PAS domain S-box protein [Phycisphaerae bacterium]
MDTQCAKVLIIDNDPNRRRLAAETLASHNNGIKFDVQCLPACTEAMDLIEKEHFDAVGLDCTQHDAVGHDWIEALRSLRPESAVIALRGSLHDHHLASGSVDDSVFTGASDVWQTFAGRIREAIVRHRADESLRRACQTFEAIIRNAPDAIVCISPAGRILEFNARAEALWNLPRSAAIGADYLEICFSQQERFRINCEMQLLSPGESAKDLRSFITLADGREAPLSWDFSSVSTENGTGDIIIAVAREARGAADADRVRQVAFNPHFNDTVDLVLNSLCAIMDRIDCIHARITPETLEHLRNSYEDADQNGRRIPPKTAAAIEKLILGLITEQKQVS